LFVYNKLEIKDIILFPMFR